MPYRSVYLLLPEAAKLISEASGVTHAKDELTKALCEGAIVAEGLCVKSISPGETLGDEWLRLSPDWWLRSDILWNKSDVVLRRLMGPISDDGVRNSLQYTATVRSVRVSRQDVLALWFADDTARSAKVSPTDNRKNKGGRPPDYDWDAFNTEIIRVADLDGLPGPDGGEGWRTQADLIRYMLDWCEKNWGRQPAESTVKMRISKIFQRVSSSQ